MPTSGSSATGGGASAALPPPPSATRLLGAVSSARAVYVSSDAHGSRAHSSRYWSSAAPEHSTMSSSSASSSSSTDCADDRPGDGERGGEPGDGERGGDAPGRCVEGDAPLHQSGGRTPWRTSYRSLSTPSAATASSSSASSGAGRISSHARWPMPGTSSSSLSIISTWPAAMRRSATVSCSRRSRDPADSCAAAAARPSASIDARAISLARRGSAPVARLGRGPLPPSPPSAPSPGCADDHSEHLSAHVCSSCGHDRGAWRWSA